MKKIALLLLLALFATPTFAQNSTVFGTSGPWVNYRADYQTALYDLFLGSTTFKDSLVPLFPDTTVIVEYTDTNLNTTHYSPSVHGLVSIYDPKSELYGYDQTTGSELYFCPTDPVDLDSVMTYGKYVVNDTNNLGRIRFDIITNNHPSIPPFNISRYGFDIDSDGSIDSLSITSVQLKGDTSAYTSGSPFTISNTTTVYRDLTIQDTGATKFFIAPLTNVQIPANGIAAVIVTYEPDTGSYTPFTDTIFLNQQKGINHYTAVMRSNRILNDDNLYWLQFSAITSLFFNLNNVTGYINTDSRYDTSTTTSAIHTDLSHQSFFRVIGIPCIFSISENSILSSQTKIFPNPNNGSFYIQLKNYADKGDFELSLSNLYGQVVYTQTARMKNGANPIQIDNLEPGVYLLTIDNGKETAVKRVVIQ